MEGRGTPPKKRDTAELSSGAQVGSFWMHCKAMAIRRCGTPPYDRLLANAVLRADYRITAQRHERVTTEPRRKAVSSKIKVPLV